MPRKRKTEDMSPTTVHRWLKIYVVQVAKMIKEERIHEREGRQVIRGLAHSVKYLEASKNRFLAEKRASEQAEYEDTVERLS